MDIGASTHTPLSGASDIRKRYMTYCSAKMRYNKKFKMKNSLSVIKTDILNCFGFNQTHKLSIDQAHNLLVIARNPWINLYYDKKLPDQIKNIGDYAIGHAELKYADFQKRYGKKFQILLTTDRAKSVETAVKMADRGGSLFDKNVKIKLEVLTKDYRHPINDFVIEAAQILRSSEKKYCIWPIINYNEKDIVTLANIGVEVIRVMRGPFGCNGTIKEVPDLNHLGKIGIDLKIPIILEGGIGNDKQVYEALITPGIKAILINSCLFKPLDDETTVDPIYMMKTIRHAADLASRNKRYHPYNLNCCSISKQIEDLM